LPVSEIEWYVSESIDGLPVRRNPTNFMIAIAPLAINAAITTPLLLPAITFPVQWRRQMFVGSTLSQQLTGGSDDSWCGRDGPDI
jgi:hypothetical protein